MSLDLEPRTEQGERSPKHVPGEPGIWLLLFGDMVVFAILFAVYLGKRGDASALFASSQDSLNRNFGAINTLVLLLSSLLVVLAMRALRSETTRAFAPRLLLGAIACGVFFIVIKAFEYHDRIAAGDTPGSNQFFMYYFVLTGLHLAHLVVGLLVLAGLFKLAKRPNLSPMLKVLFECGACFWHMVDLLWIMIFPLMFLVR